MIFKKQLSEEKTTYFEGLLPYMRSGFLGIYVESSTFTVILQTLTT